MKKMIPTKERIFISLVGTSGSRKFHPIFACLKFGTSQPALDNFCYFYQHYQPSYSQMQRNKPKICPRNRFRLDRKSSQ